MEQVRSTDGTMIAFERQGKGDPVVLVHGTTGSMATWGLVVPYLTKQFTVINMDRRGRGASGDGNTYTLDLEADDVAAVIEAVGEPVHLVGHSFGARLALLMATRTTRLRSLVMYEAVVATQHTPVDLVDRAEALVHAGDMNGAAELFLTEGAVIPPTEVEVLKALPPVWERITAGITTAFREVRALDGVPIDLESLRGVTVPVLIVIGSETTAPLYLDGLDEIERALPNARRCEIPGQRHLAVGFAPDIFAGMVSSFLMSVEPSEPLNQKEDT